MGEAEMGVGKQVQDKAYWCAIITLLLLKLSYNNKVRGEKKNYVNKIVS